MGKMLLWGIYTILVLAFLGTAIYEHVTASNLALPLSPTLTILTILLPILSIANAVFLPLFLRPTSASAQKTRQFVATSVNIVQVLLTTVLATLLLSTAIPSAARTCLIGTTWQSLFSSKDAAAIRRIQDAFECCGFNSVRDRAWPFAEDLGSGPACAKRFGRSVACGVPWTAALQRIAGTEGGIVVAIGVLQILVMLLARRMSNAQQNAAYQTWAGLKHLLLPGSNSNGAHRPLLAGEAHTEAEEVSDNGQDASTEDEEAHRRAEPPLQGYGGTATGPRVEPARFSEHEEPNAWGRD